VEGAVAEEAEAAGVGGEVATDVAGPFGAEVEGDDVAAFADVVVQGLEDAAGIAGEDAGGVVKVPDAVEAGEGEDDLVKDGDAAADEASVAALGDDGELVLGAVGDNLGDLVGRLWLEDELGGAAILLPGPGA
jgi:hypothetical protein